MKNCLIISALIFSILTGCQDPMKEELSQWVKDNGASYGVQGFSASFYFPEDGNWNEFYGISTTQESVIIDNETLFAVGSFAKVYTAAIILKLVEEGELKLDDVVGDYLRDYLEANPNIDQNLSLSQLLNQTSGLFDYTDNMEFWSILEADSFKNFTDDEIIALVKAPVAEPGVEYRYCNTNYYLLGMIIKKVLNYDSLPEAYHDYLFEPMKLNETYFGYDDLIPEYYKFAEITMESGSGLFRGAANAGGLFSTSSDVIKWVKKLFNGKFINNESIDLMTTFNDGGYGFGCMELNISGRTVYGHIGIIPNCGSILFYDPENGVCGTVIVNDLSGAENIIIGDLYNIVLENM